MNCGGPGSLHVYRHVAFNQCAVLAAFEAAGWPPRVEDALYRATGKKSKKRRRNTIKSLNQMLRGTPIRFCATGRAAASAGKSGLEPTGIITPITPPPLRLATPLGFG